jgi:quercetin dioxygenase-like cupin family protein
MKHINYLDEKAEEITEAGAKGIQLRTVIGEKEEVPNFHMRVISFEQGGQSPNHSHDYEHEMFVIKGSGTVDVDGETIHLKTGDVMYLPPNANHCFRTKEAMELL